MARGRSHHRARGSHPAAGKRARTKSATLAQAQIARSTCGNRGASIVGRTISTATAAASVSVPTRPRTRNGSHVRTNVPGLQPQLLRWKR